MLPTDLEWLEEYLARRMELQRVKHDLTDEMLRRSQDALKRSYELLALPVPVVWHPERPQE